LIPELELVNARLSRIESLLESKLQPKYISVKQCAEFLCCSVQKVRLLLKQGLLPFYRLPSISNIKEDHRKKPEGHNSIVLIKIQDAEKILQ